jgi:N-methylhydantoinase A
MGGTSTDVCRIEGGVPEISFERVIDGQVCRMPSTAVHTVGAGGGSIAWVDAGGSLRVGPQSAGAAPGPASYGRGGSDLTVTDANLLTGRLGADSPLAGGLRLDVEKARTAAQRLGEDLGMPVEELALGVMRVVDAHMERAIRTVSVEEGADPREAVLVAFGGAGGLHAVTLARHLDMRGVVIPPAAGVFSALGLLLSRPRWERARSVILSGVRAAQLDSELVELAAQVEAEYLTSIGGHPAEVVSHIDARYLGQSHETTVPYAPGEGWPVLEERFHRAHLERNGFSRPGTPVEAVTLRVTAVGDPELEWSDLPSASAVRPLELGRRQVLTPEGPVQAAVVRRSGLGGGVELDGPLVVEEGEATTWIPEGCRLSVHETGALEVSW